MKSFSLIKLPPLSVRRQVLHQVLPMSVSLLILPPLTGVHGAIPTDGSQCYGFEHEAHEYCSNESVATWVWIRGPAPAWSSVVPAAASAERVVPGAKKLHVRRLPLG